MHFYQTNVNDSFRSLVSKFFRLSTNKLGCEYPLVKTTSRVGDVLQIVEPVIITYQEPLQRVLFNETRDANPFFHVMESLWLLAGRNDVAPLNYYSSKYSTFCSDDGVTQHAAYGKRWREWFGYDQLACIIEELKKNPSSRRCVLSMWDACCCTKTKVPHEIYGRARHDLWMATNGGKDTPCNTHAYFLINNGKLDMTVCNRSNDLILGCLGANVVHFSFLAEYLAANIGVPIGVYNQVTTNLHVYESNFKPELWLGDLTPDYYQGVPRLNYVPLVQDPARFEEELMKFNEHWLGRDLMDKIHLPGSDVFKEPFFTNVAYPMALAFFQHKKRAYKVALEWANQIAADDWCRVAVNWLRRRQARYNVAKDDGPIHEENPYYKNEIARIKEGE